MYEQEGEDDVLLHMFWWFPSQPEASEIRKLFDHKKKKHAALGDGLDSSGFGNALTRTGILIVQYPEAG